MIYYDNNNIIIVVVPSCGSPREREPRADNDDA